jgi:hypothetical protein
MHKASGSSLFGPPNSKITRAPALTARTNCYANFAYSAATLDKRANSCQPGLKFSVIFIAEQSRHLPRKSGSFDQLHVLRLSAIGG